MLSVMETPSSKVPEPDRSAADDLRDLDEARRDFAGSLVVPRGYDTIAGAASGLLVAAIGLITSTGSSMRTTVGSLLAVTAFAALGWSVQRFKMLNGAWVSGWRSGDTTSLAAAGAAVTMVLMVIAMVASSTTDRWWVGLALAPLQMVAFIVVSRRWMVIYRREHGATA